MVTLSIPESLLKQILQELTPDTKTALELYLPALPEALPAYIPIKRIYLPGKSLKRKGGTLGRFG